MDIDDDDGAVRRMLAPPLDDVDNDDGLVDGPRPQQPIVDPEDGAAAADQDSDEEEEEEPEDDEEEEEEEEHPGVIEGGVAEGHEGADKILLATQADITLFFECTESFEHLYPPTTVDDDSLSIPPVQQHPILQPGVTVQIGLGKNTKLDKIMQRYADVCNTHMTASTTTNKNWPLLSLRDIEFTHVQLLNPHDTAETAALMKHDRIRVSRQQRLQRQHKEEQTREQRKFDKNSYEQWRLWLLHRQQNQETMTFPAVAIQCHKYDPQSATCQKVLRAETNSQEWVLCEPHILSKRCLWIQALISQAKHAKESQAVSVRPAHAQPERPGVVNVRAAAQIENDDHNMDVDENEKEEEEASIVEHNDDDNETRKQRIDFEKDPRVICISVPFQKRAVELLLEYIYTNRVIDLGMDAFVNSCKTHPLDKSMQGPVPPFQMERKLTANEWPNKGEPTVDFETCAQAIQLAETACLPRFSLMAEMAAAQLISVLNVVKALVLCEQQRKATGNPLVRLRRAAMDVLLRSRMVLGTQFEDSLIQQKNELVPTLLTGALEAIEAEDDEEHKARRRKAREDAQRWQHVAVSYAISVDRRDKNERKAERDARRREQQKRSNSNADDDQARRGLKRSARQISVGGVLEAVGTRMRQRGNGGDNNKNAKRRGKR